MGLLLHYLKKHWPMVFLALLSCAMNQIFSLLDPLIFRYIIDRYATKFHQYTASQFVQGVSLLLGAAVGVAFISRVAKNFPGLLRQRSDAANRSGALCRWCGAFTLVPYSVFEDQRSGETFGKLQKVRTDVERFITAFVNILFTATVGVIFVTVYALRVIGSLRQPFC